MIVLEFMTSTSQAFYLESILWRSLLHDHIVPFLGITENVLSGSFCMVLPWYERGTLRDYIGQVGRENLDTQLEEALRSSLTVWVSQLFLCSFALDDTSDRHRSSITPHSVSSICTVKGSHMEICTQATFLSTTRATHVYRISGCL